MDETSNYELFSRRLSGAGFNAVEIDECQKEVRWRMLSEESCVDMYVPVDEYLGMIAMRRQTAEIAVIEALHAFAEEACQPALVVVQ